MKYNTVKISTKQAENILLELFHIKGTATPLPGEIDFNFKIKVEGKSAYILKVSRPNENLEYLEFQQKLLQHLESSEENLTVPKVIKATNGKVIAEFVDANGFSRKVRLLSWISGRTLSKVNPQLDNVRLSLGKQCGLITKALQGFEHSLAHRTLEWDVAQSLWTIDYLHLFDREQKEILSFFQNNFQNSYPKYSKLRKAVIHNDGNDNNILVSNNLEQPSVVSVIDYGDAIYTQIINDLAIICAYGIMPHIDPLEASLQIIKGYHTTFSLQENELTFLYNAIAMRLVITVTKSAINKLKEPENRYHLISEKPAWDVLKKWYKINPDFATYHFRNACGYTAHPNQKVFEEWANTNSYSLTDLFKSINRNDIERLDLSISSLWVGHQEEFNDLDFFQFKIDQLQKSKPNSIIAGGYLEPRPIYTSTEYDTIGNRGRESRSIHLGIDFWLPEKTPVYALFDGEVVIAHNDAGVKEYGGLVVLKHHTDKIDFYTLYGHLSVDSATKYSVGDYIKKGEEIAVLGNINENGNWAPHLHFQIMLSLLGFTNDFPGVAYHSQIDVWKSICPNPNLLFKSNALNKVNILSNDKLISFRKKHLGKGLSLQYKDPIKMVRGAGQYLMNSYGRKYLDTVNNVAHVGHEHHKVVKAGQEQMALINTNSRYLHENINELAKEILATLPSELNVIHFVNSGSEANELAIRMVKAHTGEQDIIASEAGYHGNTNMCVDISSYKFDSRGGTGKPKHTHLFSLPDTFRGKFRGNDVAELYAKEVQKQIDTIKSYGRSVAALIVEPIISCGGQIELPEGFLSSAYTKVRAAGGLCISDEVQVGCGRLGDSFWGFQLHDVVPDIITIGKPLGNGHPLAAVVCIDEVAKSFANGMEYFNTFGGNPVSCAIGTEVIRTIKTEKLQQNAKTVGNYLKTELKNLALKHPIIGDVRGRGLFLGIELVNGSLEPLPKQTMYLVERMKFHGILMSIDGPDLNVIKIKPPIVFTLENAQELLYYLNMILAEDFMKS